MNDKKMLIGFNTNAGRVLSDDPQYILPLKSGKGVDFLVVHEDVTNMTVKDACGFAEKTAEKLDSAKVRYVANFESQNFNYDCKAPDGFDWANHADGTHRLEFPEEFVRSLASRGNLLGVMYDEFEHVIANRNVSVFMGTKYKKDPPAFVTTGKKDILDQADFLDEQLQAYAERTKRGGAELLLGEHAFPVLFHAFARTGLTPNFKSQKESISNVQFACAAGAALQYGTKLWNCVDCWHMLTNPGHSAEEMYNNLVFAYHAGVDAVYVESAGVFTEKDKNGREVLNAHGKAFAKFSGEYRNKDRSYNILDYTPEIGIIRMDDTYWGQGRTKHFWRNMLFANPMIKVDHRAKEAVEAMNLITRGATGTGGLTQSRIEVRSLFPHRSFAGMNGAAVFDDRVKKETLKSLKLCFLCGYRISAETYKAVNELVKENGLTVVTPTRFAPADIAIKCTGKLSEIKDGKGTWIVTDDLTSPALKRRLRPFLGKKNEITLSFGEKTVRLKVSRDGNTLTKL